MKTFMIAAVVTFGMVGCADQNPRHMNMSKWHGSDMKRVDHGSKRPNMNRHDRRPERSCMKRGERPERPDMKKSDRKNRGEGKGHRSNREE